MDGSLTTVFGSLARQGREVGRFSFYGAEFNVEWVDFEVDTNRTGKTFHTEPAARTLWCTILPVLPTEIYLNADYSGGRCVRHFEDGLRAGPDVLPANFEEDEV